MSLKGRNDLNSEVSKGVLNGCSGLKCVISSLKVGIILRGIKGLKMSKNGLKVKWVYRVLKGVKV